MKVHIQQLQQELTQVHIQQLQQELTQARDFYYPAHWTEEQREKHRLRIKRLENELSWLK